MINKDNNFDVAVIGAGPAGIIAAGRAAELGCNVILIEKNRKLGEKLLLTGKGRCNITNSEFNLKKLVENYGKNGKFLFHAFSIFGPSKVIGFFKKLRLKTKIERGNRVFPITNRAKSVLNALSRYLKNGNVRIFYNSRVINIKYENNKIEKLILRNGEIVAKNYIFCTGGKSYPSTGSTGDGYRWAESLGHSIEELSPALVPIEIKENWVKRLQGLSLKNIKISIFQNGKKKDARFGECLFTHFGLSGPIVLDLSKEVGRFLKNGEVKLLIDLKPALDFEKLDKRIQRDFKKYPNKLFRNSLDDLLPKKLIPVIVKLSNINKEKKVNSVTKEERYNLIRLLKNLEVTVKRLFNFDLAIVTKGGIPLKEIDSKTMKSKIINNLFFAGEIIDIDGPSGGFNLQICWSTGFLAGENAIH